MKKNYSYWKSIYTGEIYPMAKDWMPAFGGWEQVSESAYEQYLKENKKAFDLRA